MGVTLVNDRYRILEDPGSRCDGAVCRVEDRCTGEILALKRLLDRGAERRRDFEREFLLLRDLDHPFFPRAYDYGIETTGDLPFFTMEYVEGRDLSAFLRESGSPGIVPSLLYSICLALRNLHHRGLFHGDLKPANILVEDGGGRPRPTIKILDLGLSRAFFRGEDREFSGTVNYLSPEMALGERVDQRADIYALGLTIYEGLTGGRPFEGRKIDVIRRVLSGDITPIREAVVGIPSFLAELIDAMVAVRPADRPSDVEEILGRLEDNGAVDGSAWTESLFISAPSGRGEKGQEGLVENGRLSGGEGERSERKGPKVRYIVGAVGTGKTTLMNRLKSRRQVEGLQTLWVSGSGEGGSLGEFAQLAGMVDPGRRRRECEGDGRERLDFEWVDKAIDRLVDRFGGRGISLFIDDIKRMDPDSITAVKMLLARLPGESVECFLALDEGEKPEDAGICRTTRTGGLKVLLDEIDSVAGNRETIGLNRLSRGEIEELIRGRLGDVSHGIEELVDEMERWTGGNPGMIRRLLSVLLRDGILKFSHGEWLVDVKGLKGLRPPDGTDLEVLEETAFLGDMEKEMLRHASVLGDDFDRRELVSLFAEWDPDREESLARLMARGGFIRDLGEGRFRVESGILRRGLYRQLTDDERTLLHRRAMAALRDRGGPADPIRLYRHHLGAGEREEGISCARAAVKRLREEERPLEALDLLEGLAGWVEGRREEAFWVTGETGDVLFDMKSFPEAVEAYRKAIAVAGEESSLAGRKTEIRVRLARALIRVNALDEALEILESTGDGLGWEGKHPLTCKIQREIGWIHFQRGRYKSALRFYRKSLLNSRRHRDMENLLHLYNDIAVLHVWVGDWRRAERWTARAVVEGRKEGMPGVVANARNIQGQGMKKRGKYREAERRYHQALDLFRESRDPYGMSQIFTSIGELHRERGEYEAAIPYLEKSLHLKEFLHNDSGAAISLSNLGLAYRATGKLDRAREFFGRSTDIRLRVGDRDGAGEVFGYLAETLIEMERWNEARKVLARQREALVGSEGTYGRRYNAYLDGLIDLKMELFKKAAGKLEGAIRGFESTNYPEEETRARVDYALSLHALGRIDEAEGEAMDALETARKIDHWGLTVEGHLALARILEEGGEKEKAGAHYREARELVRDTPVRPLRAKVLLAFAEHLFRKGTWRERGRDASEFDECLSEAGSLFAEMGIDGGMKSVKSLKEKIAGGIREIGGRELFTLYRAGEIINSSLDIDGILERLMDLIVQTMDVERGVIFLRDRVTGELAKEVARNVERETIEDARTFSSTILHDVERRGKPIFIPDCREDESCLESKSISRYSILSVLCVPLRLKGEIVGTIYVDDRRTSHLFRPGDVDFLMSLGDMAALAVRNARLYQDLDVAKRRLEAENRDLRLQVRERAEFHGMIGRHEKMEILYQVIEKVSQTDATVLIRGENGSGKELVARAIHYLSKRRDGPFTVVNCAAIPEALLESEIFGIEKGTATGVDRRVGKFEQADGGTIFLDEIGDMSPAVQAKLLRVLQEKRFQRLGGMENIAVDVKIVSATNKDLETAIREGTFREDLYYRLNTLPVFVPPLRERVEDIPLLVEGFLRKWSEENDRDIPTVGRGVLKILCGYPWPGNVRQLKNVVERMAVMCRGGAIEEEDVPPDLPASAGVDIGGIDRDMKKLRDVQTEYVRSTYLRCGKNKRKTCEILGITYKTLQSYLSRTLD